MLLAHLKLIGFDRLLKLRFERAWGRAQAWGTHIGDFGSLLEAVLVTFGVPSWQRFLEPPKELRKVNPKREGPEGTLPLSL